MERRSTKGKKFFILHPSESLRDVGAYNFYKSKTKKEKKLRATTVQNHTNIVGECWKEVQQGLLHQDGGVFLKGLGYFAIWMNPVRQKEHMLHHTKGYVKVFNDHSDHHAYHPTLFTETDTGQALKYWFMDRGFSQLFTRALSKLLKAGKRYTLRYTVVQGLFKKRQHAY